MPEAIKALKEKKKWFSEQPRPSATAAKPLQVTGSTASLVPIRVGVVVWERLHGNLSWRGPIPAVVTPILNPVPPPPREIAFLYSSYCVRCRTWKYVLLLRLHESMLYIRNTMRLCPPRLGPP